MTLKSFTRRMRARTLVMWAIALSLLLAFLIVGCAKEQATAVVERRDIVEYLVLTGKTAVPAAARAEIVSPYEAPVQKIYVTVGQSVRKGDVVMELSAPRTEARYQQARQQLQQARQSLGQAKSRYQADINQAQRELEQAREAERKARQQAQAQAQQPEGNGAQVTVTEQSNPDLAAAIQRRKQAEQDVLDAKAMMDEGLVPYQRRLAAAQQNFDQVQSGLKVASIRTPISGTVLEVNTEIGDTVKPDQKKPLAVIVDLDAVKVYGGVNKNQLDRVEHGDPAIVNVNSIPDTDFSGELQQVYSERAGLLKNEKFVAVVGFKNKEGKAKPGMDATAKIQTAEADDVLAVPSDAVYEVEGKPAVKIKDNNEWSPRIVEIGISDGEYTQIKSGLKEGEVVLANP